MNSQCTTLSCYWTFPCLLLCQLQGTLLKKIDLAWNQSDVGLFTWTVALGIHASETNTFSLKLNPAKDTIRNVAMIRTTRAMPNIATQSPARDKHFSVLLCIGASGFLIFGGVSHSLFCFRFLYRDSFEASNECWIICEWSYQQFQA